MPGPPQRHKQQRRGRAAPHRLAGGRAPLAAAHDAEGAIAQLLEERQVPLPDQAGQRVLAPGVRGGRRGRLAEGALGLGGQLRLGALAAEHLWGAEGCGMGARRHVGTPNLPARWRARLASVSPSHNGDIGAHLVPTRPPHPPLGVGSGANKSPARTLWNLMMTPALSPGRLAAAGSSPLAACLLSRDSGWREGRGHPPRSPEGPRALLGRAAAARCAWAAGQEKPPAR